LKASSATCRSLLADNVDATLGRHSLLYS